MDGGLRIAARLQGAHQDVQAGGHSQAEGEGKEQPVKRGDGGDQPGRGPGLEEVPEQPAGLAAGLGRGARGRRDERPLSLPELEERGQGSSLLSERDEGSVRFGGRGISGSVRKC